jgi:hypothetical protein
MSRILLLVLLLLATGVVLAEEVPEEVPEAERAAGATEAQAQENVPEAEPVADATEAPAQAEEGPKRISGMSILGNQEAPKSLVIVPWKSSELGDTIGISTMLDDSRQPVDREVFLRALSYYEIRSEGTP